jgi:hypothetical protein
MAQKKVREPDCVFDVYDAETIYLYALEQPASTRDKWGANVLDHKASSYTPGNGATITDTDTGIVRITSDGVTAISYGSITAYGVGTDNMVIGAMRGDGATGQPRAISGSTIIKLGTTSTGWQYFALVFTSTVTTLLIQNMSAIGYTEFKWVQSRPVRASVPVSGERYEYQRVENLILQSENLNTSPWVGGAATVNDATGLLSPLIDHDTKLPVEYHGIVGSVATSGHRISQDVLLTATGHVFGLVCKAGAQPWIWLYDPTTAFSVYVNPSTGETKSMTGSGADLSWIGLGDGNSLILFRFTGTAATSNMRIYPSPDGITTTYTGDGVTVDTYVTGVRLCACELADASERPYVKTTTAPVSGVQKFNLEDESIHDYRARLGLKELLVNDAPSDNWQTPVVGKEYLDGMHAGQQVYAIRYAATITVAGTQILDAATKFTKLIGQDGHATDAATGDVIAAGASAGPTAFACPFLDATNGLELRLGTDFDEVGDSYDIIVRGIR